MAKESVNENSPTPSPGISFRELLKQSREMAQSGNPCEALVILDLAETSVMTDKSLEGSERDLQLSRININRGITLKNMRELEKSAKCYEDAMAILNRIEDSAVREKFSVELNLAVLRVRLRDREKAMTGFIKAEELASQFGDDERQELLTKVLTNRAQLHLEFHEIQEARELLDRIESGRDRKSSKERKARVASQLGQLIAHIAERQESERNAYEHYNQALRFFEEARKAYEELGLTRDILSQLVNEAEILIALNRMDKALESLQYVYQQAIESNDHNLIASATSKLLVIALLKGDVESKNKWIEETLTAANKMSSQARNDFLERLESRLRWIGGEKSIERIQQLRGHKDVN